MTSQYIHNTAPVKRGLVADPVGKHHRRMRQTIWLYLYLLLAVNRATGQRLVSPAAIGRDMGISEATIRSWLGHLRKSGYIALRRQSGLVRVGITKWPKTGQPPEGRQTAVKAPRRVERPLTPETLARALECDPKDPFLAEIMARHDAGRIRDVLDEVLEVPRRRIKRSRLALFRYLITKQQRS